MVAEKVMYEAKDESIEDIKKLRDEDKHESVLRSKNIGRGVRPRS